MSSTANHQLRARRSLYTNCTPSERAAKAQAEQKRHNQHFIPGPLESLVVALCSIVLLTGAAHPFRQGSVQYHPPGSSPSRKHHYTDSRCEWKREVIQRRYDSSSAWDCARFILKSKGAAGLCAGFPVAIVEAAFTTFLRLVFNNSSSTWMLGKLLFPELAHLEYGIKYALQEVPVFGKGLSVTFPGGREMESAKIAVMAVLLGCGLLYCTSTVRNRIIVQAAASRSPGSSKTSLLATEISCTDDILRRYGWTGFFKGCLPTVLLYGATMSLMVGLSSIALKVLRARIKLPGEVQKMLISEVGGRFSATYALE